MDPVWLLYNFDMVAVVACVTLELNCVHRNHPNKTKVVLYHTKLFKNGYTWVTRQKISVIKVSVVYLYQG